jgi:hypothetical protein
VTRYPNKLVKKQSKIERKQKTENQSKILGLLYECTTPGPGAESNMMDSEAADMIIEERDQVTPLEYILPSGYTDNSRKDKKQQ